uniref:ORF1a protein n=1 Tax=Cardioderma bat astrovirus TaxID=3141857 RepID=A0AAU7E1V8_9VIRU
MAAAMASAPAKKQSPLEAPLNRAALLGYAPAWDLARKKDSKAKNPLSTLVGEDAMCLCYFSSTKFGHKQPMVHTVSCDNTYTAWRWIESKLEWEECDTFEYSMDTRLAIMGTMNNKRKQLENENCDLKRENSQLKLDLMLMKQPKYERPTKQWWDWKRMGFLFFFLLVMFFPMAKAEIPPSLDEQIFGTVNETAHTISDWLLRHANTGDIVSVVTSYRFTAIVLGIVSLWRSESPIFVLLLLIVAYVTKYRYVAVASTAFMNVVSTATLMCVMVIDLVNPIYALYFSALQLMVALVLGLVADDVKYAQIFKGHSMVLVASIVSFFAKSGNIPDPVVVSMLVVWRVIGVINFVGKKVEVKDCNGKIVESVPAKNAWFSKALGIGSLFSQKLRKKTSVPVRVMTNAIIGIEGEGGLGTGFRVANHLITASHVVGTADVVRVTWGMSKFTAKVVRHCGNDVCILNLPSEAHSISPFKLAKTIADGVIAVTGMNMNGDYVVAVSEGVIVKDHWTYAVQTIDGMSGAPVTNEAGRVVGVHLSNTGFTGGGAVLRPEHVHDETEVEKLRRRVRELEESKPSSPLDQGLTNSEISSIVNLVREAVRNEMEVLRHELDLEISPFEQAKGRNKGPRRNKRTRAWTEEEYRAMQEQGYTRTQLKNMAEEILERMHPDDDETELGYPEWSEPSREEREEIEREWFGQKETAPVDFEHNPNTHPQDIQDKYSLGVYYITGKDLELVGDSIREYEDIVMKWILRNLNERHEWRKEADRKSLSRLSEERIKLEKEMSEKGLVPFSQRKKKEKKVRTIKKVSKNSKSPQAGAE